MPLVIDSRTVNEVDTEGDLILLVGEKHVSEGRFIRVSSKVLTQKSPFFDAMLNGQFREGQVVLDKNKPPVLDLPADHSSAMLVLCEILHPGASPTTLGLCLYFVEVGVLADKYGCQEATKLWLSSRLQRKKHTFLLGSAGTLARIAHFTFFFDEADMFHIFTKRAILSVDWTVKTNAFVDGLDDMPQADAFAIALTDVQITLKSRLSKKCQQLLDHSYQVHHSRELSRRNMHGNVAIPGKCAIKLPVVCRGQAMRSAKFIAATRRLGLWRGTEDERRVVTLDTAMETLVQMMHDNNDKPPTCDKSMGCLSLRTRLEQDGQGNGCRVSGGDLWSMLDLFEEWNL